jgi:hypothetical protein
MKSLFLTLGFFFFVNEFTPVVAMKSKKSKKSHHNQKKEVDEQKVFWWWSLYGNTWAEFLTKPDKTPWCPYIPHGFISRINDNRDDGYFSWKTDTITKELVFMCTACQHEVKSYNMFDILRRRKNKNINSDSCCSTCCNRKLTRIAKTKLQHPEEAQETISSAEVTKTEEAQEQIFSLEATKNKEVCEVLTLENLQAWRSLTEQLMNDEFKEEQRERQNRIQEISNSNKNKKNMDENQISKAKWHVVKKK